MSIHTLGIVYMLIGIVVFALGLDAFVQPR